MTDVSVQSICYLEEKERIIGIVYLVVIAGVDIATHTEIGYFDGKASSADSASGPFSYQTIAARQIAVNEMLRRQIGHSVCNLFGNRMQIILLYKRKKRFDSFFCSLPVFWICQKKVDSNQSFFLLTFEPSQIIYPKIA